MKNEDLKKAMKYDLENYFLSFDRNGMFKIISWNIFTANRICISGCRLTEWGI